jgi:hypothetical protein
MTFSKNGIGLSIIIIETILSALGVEFEPGTVARMVEGIVIAVSMALLIWNQIDRPEIHSFIFKQ